MDKRSEGIKVVCKSSCPIETIEGFNKRIAEIIAIKFSKEFIGKLISEYESNKQNIT